MLDAIIISFLIGFSIFLVGYITGRNAGRKEMANLHYDKKTKRSNP